MSDRARYTVYARDVLFQNLGEISDFSTCTVQLRFNDIGSFHITGLIGTRTATLLSKTGGIIIHRDNRDGLGPSVIFSGFVTDYIVDDQMIEVAGSSDERLLNERVASPFPAGPPYGVEQDLREGIASTVMIQYVDVNCGPSAIARRQVDQLNLVEDPGLGSYVYGQARWISLLSLQQELALAGGGLRFQVVQSTSSVAEIDFTVTEPRDLTGQIVVSKGRGTLGSWKRTTTRPAATYVYVLGQGQGINRQVVEGGDGELASEYGRYIEHVADRRDTDNVEVLQQTRANLLEENGELQVVQYTPVDTGAFQWGLDYDLGDRVTVLMEDSESLQEIVRGVNLNLLPSGDAVRVTPIISTPGDSADDPASRQSRAVSRRVSSLERNIDSLAAAVAVQWNLGNLRATCTTGAAPGWLLCDGAAHSRLTYSALFGIIGTNYGAGDGSTTFNVPDYRDMFLIGASGTRPLHSTGGSLTLDLAHTHTGAAHHHQHFHTGPSHNHTGAAHTHLGPLHNHTGAAHTHSHDHAGPNHNHGGAAHTHPGSHQHGGNTGVASAETNNLRTVSPEEADAASKDHTHNIGSDSSAHAASYSSDTGDAGTGATDTDATAASFSGNTGNEGNGATGAASYTGNSGDSGTGSTSLDSTGATYSAESGSALSDGTSIVPPYRAVNWEIYAGV